MQIRHCSEKWALSPSLGVFCPWPFLSAQGFFPALKTQGFFSIQFLLHSPHLERRGCRTMLDLQLSGILWFPILSKNSVISVNSTLSPSAMQGASAFLLVFRYSVLYAVFAFHFLSGVQPYFSPYRNPAWCVQILVETHAVCQAASPAAFFQFISS